MLGDRIRQLREEHRMTQAELAAYLGLTPKAVSFFELNQRKPSHGVLVKLSQKFNVTIDSLLENSVASLPKEVRIPILGKVVAGTPLEAITDILGYTEIPSEMADEDSEYFALMVKGDSMAPAICDGSTVIVRKQDSVEDKQLAVVLVNGKEATVKEVRLISGGIMLVPWNPSAYNPQFYSDDDIARLPVQILGRVVENRRKF